MTPLTPINNNIYSNYDLFSAGTTEDAISIAKTETVVEENALDTGGSEENNISASSGLYALVSRWQVTRGNANHRVGLGFGCGGEVSEVCTVSTDPLVSGRTDYIYGSAESISPAPDVIYSSEYLDGKEVVWTPNYQPYVTNCDKSTSGIKVRCKFQEGLPGEELDEHGNYILEVTPDENGKLEIRRTLYQPLSSPVMCDVVYINPNNNNEERIREDIIKLWKPTTTPSTNDQCVDYPTPIVVTACSIGLTSLEPNLGDYQRIAFPLDCTKECNGDPGSMEGPLKGTFIIGNAIAGNMRYTASKDASEYYTNLTLAAPLFAPGRYTVQMELKDSSREHEILPLTNPVDFYLQGPEGDYVCYSVPEPGAYNRNPGISDIVKGDNTFFTWTYQDLTDCYGYPLLHISDNTPDILHNPVVSYDGNTLTVTGRILPTVAGGTIRLRFEDSSGNIRIVNLYLPTIKPLEMQYTTPDNFFQEDKAVDFFLLSDVPGATNYRYTIATPSGTEGPFNLPSSAINYTPTQTGLHTLNLEVTTYNGGIVSTSLPFGVNAASAQAVCYDIPNPGSVTVNPLLPQIVRGDNTFFTWTVNGLTDCLLGALTLYSDNTSDILYNQSITYNTNTHALTVSGRVRSDIAGGSAIRVTFMDSWGHPKIINLSPPIISEPEIVIVDPWITLSENLDLSLLDDPAGASFLYSITRPDNSSFNSGTLSNSPYTIPAGNKNQIGIYQMSLCITPADNQTYCLPKSFVVHQN